MHLFIYIHKEKLDTLWYLNKNTNKESQCYRHANNEEYTISIYLFLLQLFAYQPIGDLRVTTKPLLQANHGNQENF